MSYDPETQDLEHPHELRLLKYHYIGWKRTQTLRLPTDTFHWSNAQFQTLFGRGFTRNCSKCNALTNEILSLLIRTGIGDS